MTPFVEAARQLVRGLFWADQPIAVLHNGKQLTWRHHGLGMLQAEISETLRIHIWHPKLVSEGMAWPRCVHDHRFDITSAVIVGEVIDVPCEVNMGIKPGHSWPKLAPGWQEADVYEIEHAKIKTAWLIRKDARQRRVLI